MAAFVNVSLAAVRFVDPDTATMQVDEDFNTPYLAEISTQEGEYFTRAQMEAITKVRLYFGETEYTDSAACSACFDYVTYKASSKIIIDVASINWTDGTQTATLFIYTPTYPLGLRVGTFVMTADGSLGTANLSPVTGFDPDLLAGDTVDDDKVDAAILPAETDPLSLKPADIGVTVQAAGSYEPAGVTAPEVGVTTSAFGGLFSNDASHDTVQELFDILDDADFGGMTNPMDAAGEMIIGGTAGAPTALAKGANNTLLGIDGSGTLGWQSSFSLDDSAAQFYNATSTTKLAKILCSGITAGQTRVMTWPDKDFTPAVLGSNLVPASSYYNFGTVAGSTGYGLRDNSGTMEYKNSGGSWAGIGTGGGGTPAGAQYDVQIAGASDFDAVTGEFKYQANTLYVGTGGMSQAKTSGQAGSFTLYTNNSTDTTGAGLKGPSATLANSYHLIFPSTEPSSANSIWVHGAASSHLSAGSWLVVGTSANNLVQLDGSAKLPAVDGSALTNVSSTQNDTETIYDADGGTVNITKNNAIVIVGAAATINPLTPDDSPAVNFAVSNNNGVTTQITINCPTGCYLGKADGSGYLNQNQDYRLGGAATDTIVYVAISTTHYKCWTATGTWTGL